MSVCLSVCLSVCRIIAQCHGFVNPFHEILQKVHNYLFPFYIVFIIAQEVHRNSP